VLHGETSVRPSSYDDPLTGPGRTIGVLGDLLEERPGESGPHQPTLETYHGHPLVDADHPADGHVSRAVLVVPGRGGPDPVQHSRNVRLPETART
jgi:hypothetical protein